MDEELFFGIAHHKLILVGKDGSYTKQVETSYIMIAPGQSLDLLLRANQPHGHYVMAGRPYSSAFGAGFDKTMTTAIVEYSGSDDRHHHPRRTPYFPELPL